MAHRLRDQIPVECSVSEAEDRLEAYFGARRGKEGVTGFRLRVPLGGPLSSYAVSVDREVRVEVRRTRDDQNLNDLIRIRWLPEGTVVFPAFEGTLVVWSDGDRHRCFIELLGTYEPPLGAAGQLFDEAIGHRIARATAREFLGDLKRAIELSKAPR